MYLEKAAALSSNNSGYINKYNESVIVMRKNRSLCSWITKGFILTIRYNSPETIALDVDTIASKLTSIFSLQHI